MMEQSRLEGKVQQNGKYGELRRGLEEDYTADRCHIIERCKKALNQWLLVVPCTANSMVLNKQAFHNQVLMRDVITPKDLPKVCNGCGKKHSLQHALQCKKGGLIGGHHNEVQDDLGVVGTQAISPHAVCIISRVQSSWDSKRKRDDLVDYQVQDNKNGEVQVIKKKDKDKDKTLIGDVLMCHLSRYQTDTIIDVRITDTDTKLYIFKPLEQVLLFQEKEKKVKYLQA
eukprot:9020384-Ditylum_brightwellii.AAC.1